jgi:hypothetical protein
VKISACSQKSGFNYFMQPIALPLKGTADFIAQLWRDATARTKVIFWKRTGQALNAEAPVLWGLSSGQNPISRDPI